MVDKVDGDIQDKRQSWKGSSDNNDSRILAFGSLGGKREGNPLGGGGDQEVKPRRKKKI